MKIKRYVIVIASVFLLLPFSKEVKGQSLGLNNATPDASSILDAIATNRGILIPRMTTANRTAIAAPADGLLVYDTDLDAFYYYDATAVASWRALLASSKSTATLGGWSTLGNAGTVAGTNFLGTTDAVDLVFKTGVGPTERMRIVDGATPSLKFPDGMLVDLSLINASSISEGLKLPQATDVSTGTAEGQLSWESDRDILWIGQAAGLIKGLLGKVSVQVLNAGTVTYTAPANLSYALVICVGSGGSGTTVEDADEAGGGGGGGGTAIELLSAATIGASQAVSIGASPAIDAGGNTTSFGSPVLLQATGGAVGTETGNFAIVGYCAAGGVGGIGTLGDLNCNGGCGGFGITYSGIQACGGIGGSSTFGGGGNGGWSNTASAAGTDGTFPGGGGGGASASDGTDRAGGRGAAGVIYVIEFLY